MEQRLQMLEQALQEVRDSNLQLQGALQEQRAHTAAASNGPPRPAARDFGGIVDTRLIGKPKSFSGREEDWQAWAMMTRAYTGAVSERLAYLMDQSENAPSAPVNAALGEQNDRELSTQLFY